MARVQEFTGAKHLDKPKEILKLTDCVMNQHNRVIIGSHNKSGPVGSHEDTSIDRKLDTPGVHTRKVGASKIWLGKRKLSLDLREI